MSGIPITLAASNLSHAWGKAFLEVLRRPVGKSPPLVVSIGGFDTPLPPEDAVLRSSLDASLEAAKCNSCDVSAMVIFPYKLWLRRGNLSCEDFCNLCVESLYPRLYALDQRNRHGMYFTRMMAYDGLKKGKCVTVNQVMEVVDRLRGRRHFRATGLQLTCFNPILDHNRQPRLGFPCLQHVGVTYEGEHGIAVTGFYPSQHIFDRAYGNYLGLAQLGRFLCDQTGLSLLRVNCITTRPLLGDTTKSAVESLRIVVTNQLEANNVHE